MRTIRTLTPDSVDSENISGDRASADFRTEQRIRVLIFTNSVAIGGMEKHAEMLARDLDRAYADVYTICPRWEAIDPWAADFAEATEGVHVAHYRHSARLTPDRRYGLPALARETYRLWAQLRQWRIQVMHMHVTTYRGGIWALMAARLAGVRVVVCTEHLAPEASLSSFAKWRRDLVTRNLDQVVCVSLKNRQARENHLYTPASKTAVVNNGVDVRNFEPTPPDEVDALRQRLGIPQGAPVVGTAVRFVEEKGLNYLFDAMPRVLAAAPDAYLLMVGEGPLREALEQQAATLGFRERVVFAGFQEDPRPYLSLMNAFVLPVPFGSASIGLLEAMAMRRAVIITFGGEGEAVIDGETGFAPPPRDPEALAEAIKKVILHPEVERRIGENARRRIEDDFSAQSVAEQLLHIYQHELAEKLRPQEQSAQ